MRAPFTFTRPGSAWVMDRSGIYVERGVDEPRYQWTPDGKSEGLLIEPQATNLVPYSDGDHNPSEFWAGSWSGVREAVPSVQRPNGFAVRVAPPPAGSPAAGVFAKQFTVDSSGGIWIHMVVKALGGVRTMFSQFRNATAAESLGFWRVNLDTGVIEQGAAYLRSVRLVRGGLCEIVAHHDFPEGDSALIYIARTSSWQPGNEHEYHFEFIQVAVGENAPGSYIPTAGSPVTRPADSLYADMSLVDGFDPTRGTIGLSWADLQSIGYPIMLSADDVDPLNADHIRIDRDDGKLIVTASVDSVEGSTAAYAEDTPVAGTPSRMFVRYDGDEIAMSFAGNDVRKLIHSEGGPQGLRYLFVGHEAHGLYRGLPIYSIPLPDESLKEKSGA